MRKLDLRIVIVVFIVLISGFYFFYSQQKSLPISTYGLSQEESAQTVASRNDSSAAATRPNVGLESSADTSVGKADSSEKIERLQVWLASEAKNLDQPHIDTKQKDLELKKRIENFSDEEKKLVLASSIDSKRPVNERILSTYLLVLDQSQTSLENLGELASKAWPDLGPATPHSEAEIRRGQELAVRYMAIDELAKRAINSSEALEILKKNVNLAESAEIRSYAQRVLNQIK